MGLSEGCIFDLNGDVASIERRHTRVQDLHILDFAERTEERVQISQLREQDRREVGDQEGSWLDRQDVDGTLLFGNGCRTQRTLS